MKKISIVMPCETNRIPLLLESIKAYESFGVPEDVEFIIVSRTIKNGQLPFNHKLVTYDWTLTPDFFNPSLALNLGVKASKYDNIIITCPEVKPYTNCLQQLQQLERGNYVCQTFDMHENGTRRQKPLVNSEFRFEHPGFYFLALYKKEDIEAINGWDLNFMYGWAWDDNDFGERFVRAGLEFQILDDIQAEHQYHPRLGSFGHTWNPKRVAYSHNFEIVERHKLQETTKINPGLKQVEEWYIEKKEEMRLQNENC